jgi:hypothetical protein
MLCSQASASSSWCHPAFTPPPPRDLSSWDKGLQSTDSIATQHSSRLLHVTSQYVRAPARVHYAERPDAPDDHTHRCCVGRLHNLALDPDPYVNHPQPPTLYEKSGNMTRLSIRATIIGKHQPARACDHPVHEGLAARVLAAVPTCNRRPYAA